MSGFYVGIMSGTSLDGIDIALVSVEGQQATLIGATCLPFPPSLYNDLLTLCNSGPDEIHRAGLAGMAWARLAASGIDMLLAKHSIDASQVKAIGSHGQTIRHHPEQGFSCQIGAPALLAELSGISVISDFRSRDLAAGGQGAPLVPAFHQWLLSSPEAVRVLVNIGGFSNLTVLRPNQSVTGFDSGPGNVLLDHWINRHHGEAFDRDGNWARSGKVNDELLAYMLSDSYFQRQPPKSTGREYFNASWLDAALQQASGTFDPADIQATLLELTARSIAQDVFANVTDTAEIYVCGGGARNRWLMERLAQLLAPLSVRSTHAVGVDPDWMEAIAFAWLAWRFDNRETSNLPVVTGARGTRILGALYPA
ncbi:anhydro-N-acetylmuramic acid kinase [Pseudomonas sp. gcc21]|uniref:anhydro-N-acetylmuramic acid kinase n=1 Tax=Pseudomonas sp. gcc21 TaxID=2726989 RepID=UPI001451DB3B|nr:anhydro-N-acetylmuramic acid kinase [Pseudomonas sp. gcc21]QJD60192.1 anhydro-N-acetylmuramic acid kinase [Pseudomonas sp. gcc21]